MAFLMSFSCSKTKRATMALSSAVEGSLTLVADLRRCRTVLAVGSLLLGTDVSELACLCGLLCVAGSGLVCRILLHGFRLAVCVRACGPCRGAAVLHLRDRFFVLSRFVVGICFFYVCGRCASGTSLHAMGQVGQSARHHHHCFLFLSHIFFSLRFEF